nr:hypothetical transcript [Hymenolepis microstoma]
MGLAPPCSNHLMNIKSSHYQDPYLAQKIINIETAQLYESARSDFTFKERTVSEKCIADRNINPVDRTESRISILPR